MQMFCEGIRILLNIISEQIWGKVLDKFTFGLKYK